MFITGVLAGTSQSKDERTNSTGILFRLSLHTTQKQLQLASARRETAGHRVDGYVHIGYFEDILTTI